MAVGGERDKVFYSAGVESVFFWNWNCRFPPRGPRKSPSNFPVTLKFAKTTREKIAGRTSIPPCGSHPFIVCLSVVRAEITNFFGPKDSRQDTTLLACATMLLSNARNYCRTSGQRVKALRLSESSLHLIRREGGVHRRRGSVGSRAHLPRGWNLFFSGTGTADFHPEVLEKARPISPLC